MLTLALAGFLTAAPAQLTIEVKPEDSVVKVDGKKVGTGHKNIVLKLSPGKHAIRVEHKGDATNDEVVLKAGEKKSWKWEFTGGDKQPTTTEPIVPETGDGAAPK
jgi:hypothetical protein